MTLLYWHIFRTNCLRSNAQYWHFVNNVYIGMSTSWILLRNYTAVWAKIYADVPTSRIGKKKSSPEKCIFFFAKSLLFDLSSKTATSECMPHRSFASKLLHEYNALFFNFRLDFLIGLKIKFDVRHRNVQKWLILPIRRLKNALCHFFINISLEQTAY